MERIVVGVDGSPNSRRALEWAIAHARHAGARIVVVRAWHELFFLGSPYTTAAYDPEVLRRCVQANLDAFVADLDARDVVVDARVVEGAAVPVLIEAAEHAHLLVVGTRAHDGVAGLLLGSVATQLARHVPCPIVIVPPDGIEGASPKSA